MWRVALIALIALSALSAVSACKPGGTSTTHELCAKATAMYERCENHEGMQAIEWDLVLDRWRGLCRAVITGETKQLLPDGLQMYTEMSDEVRAGLKIQAECTATATTCEAYRACEK